MQISKKLAVKLLDTFDEADADGKLIKVLGGFSGMLQVRDFMEALKLADIDGVETVEVSEADFRKFFGALKTYKESKGEELVAS